ncbi:unnamed protein product (macronuclear) [Paramecium tetraurelia]|uniref:Dienelactone hydrolase domain-containing protein n=1 Tax=Paramecium tetraurelia TaxID=5888 RepID=A0BK73_PARTE|nr:uncharacterized protein GSPATT00029570001 [Paramecium tetraurelia]CAK58940.1 unnamed protein product [Paramecium tetraurelia]|eukprot:XP_001426338.1 hypothetical protein (macronuclear) [Paramecium tetraurelia strain d4-2]
MKSKDIPFLDDVQKNVQKKKLFCKYESQVRNIWNLAWSQKCLIYFKKHINQLWIDNREVQLKKIFQNNYELLQKQFICKNRFQGLNSYTLQTIGGKLPVYVTPAPYGLVVIQEWWGLNSSICKTADIMSSYGFKCVVPDLYRGKIAKDTEEAGHLLSGLDWKQALIDIEESARYLKEELHCQKVGILGFCMGGALSIAAITTSKIISAAAPFYGVCDLSAFKLSNANGPILAQFGQNDEMVGFSSVQDAKRLEQTAQSENMARSRTCILQSRQTRSIQLSSSQVSPRFGSKVLT